MIAAAAQKIATNKLLFNWFDVALVFVILFGFWRGRRNGMTKEFLPTTQLLLMVIAPAFGYQPLGDFLIQQGAILKVFGTVMNEKTAAYLSGYLIITALVIFIFALIKPRIKARLEGSTAFGSSEYYLGMMAGIVRYLCILIFGLALLNAPYYTLADTLAAKAYSNRWFGGGVAGFSGDLFPTVSETQVSIFKDSLTGPFVKDNLAILLINTVTVDHQVKPQSQGKTEIILQRQH